jgi:hypothetical protein
MNITLKLITLEASSGIHVHDDVACCVMHVSKGMISTGERATVLRMPLPLHTPPHLVVGLLHVSS